MTTKTYDLTWLGLAVGAFAEAPLLLEGLLATKGQVITPNAHLVLTWLGATGLVLALTGGGLTLAKAGIAHRKTWLVVSWVGILCGVAWLIAVSLTAQLEGVGIADVLADLQRYRVQLAHNALYSLLLHLVLGLGAYTQTLDGGTLEQEIETLRALNDGLERRLADTQAYPTHHDDAVLDTLDSNPCTVAELRSTLQLSDSQVRRALHRLVADGEVESIDTYPKQYRLPHTLTGR